MTELSRIMELRGKLDSSGDIARLDSALTELGNSFKALLEMTKQLMQGNTPEKLNLDAAERAVGELRELGKNKGYNLLEFNNQKELCDFIVKFGSEIIRN